jgi:hypothetical protein
MPIATHAIKPSLPDLVARSSWSISQVVLDTSQVLTESRQNKFALFAARHLRTKQFEDERIGRLANSFDSCRGSLRLQATQASAIDKRLWVLAYGSTAKLGNSVAGRVQDD